MSKHTQGPWQAVQLEEGLFEIRSRYAERLPIVTLDKRRDGHEGYRTVETPANAYLIAAAPELFEALKDIRENNLGSVERKRGWDNALTAIAKAEGRL